MTLVPLASAQKEEGAVLKRLLPLCLFCRSFVGFSVGSFVSLVCFYQYVRRVGSAKAILTPKWFVQCRPMRSKSVCVCVCVRVCVCVWVRRAWTIASIIASMPPLRAICVWVYVCVSVCVCEWSKERQKKRACVGDMCTSCRMSCSMPCWMPCCEQGNKALNKLVEQGNKGLNNLVAQCLVDCLVQWCLTR